jgi:hypothetical protein
MTEGMNILNALYWLNPLPSTCQRSRIFWWLQQNCEQKAWYNGQLFSAAKTVAGQGE